MNQLQIRKLRNEDEVLVRIESGTSASYVPAKVTGDSYKVTSVGWVVDVCTEDGLVLHARCGRDLR